MAKGSKFAVECDWNSKISQNVQNLGFLANRWVFWKKSWFFLLKIAKGSKSDVEGDWNSRTS